MPFRSRQDISAMKWSFNEGLGLDVTRLTVPQVPGKAESKPGMEAFTGSAVLKSFISGAISGSCSTILFQPLDLVKTRLQNARHFGSSQYGMVTIFTNVVRNEKITALWKGMSPSLARCVPGVGIYFASLNWLTGKLTSGDPTAVQAVVLGIVARSVSGVSLLPLTVVKTRFESGVYEYKGVGQALRKIYVSEGAKGLYSGLTATLFRDAPFSGIYLMIYTQLKKQTPTRWKRGQLSSVVYFGCGVFAGCVAAAVTQPADVIKTQMQLYPDKFSKLPQAAIYIYQTSGFAGYFRGLVPRLVRRTLMSAMAWTVYEQLMLSIAVK